VADFLRVKIGEIFVQNQPNTQVLARKNPNFKIFFYSFSYKLLRKFIPQKIAYFSTKRAGWANYGGPYLA